MAAISDTAHRNGDRGSSQDSQWMKWERAPSSVATIDSDQRRHLKSPRRDEEDEEKEWKRQKSYRREEEGKTKKNKYNEEDETATSLKRAKRYERQEFAKNKTQKINKNASYMGCSWICLLYTSPSPRD